jgi:hypothetical protein
MAALDDLAAEIERIRADARAEERERCAKIAERLGDEWGEPAIGGGIAKFIRDPVQK